MAKRRDTLREGARAHYLDPTYYDRIYRRRRKDVAYYVAQAQHVGGPVLELGCGSGRVTHALARAGIEVVGVDAVDEMLAHEAGKRRKLPREARGLVTTLRGDVRSVRLRRRFPLVIAPFGVFMHLYTREDLERALRTVTAHLAPKGRLIFDVLMPDLRSLLRDPSKLFRCPDLRNPRTGRRYHYMEAFSYDAKSQVQRVSMIFEAMDTEDEVEVRPLSQRLFFPAELEMLLHYNGFAIESHTGDFREHGLDRDDESQVIVARRLSRRPRTAPRES